VSTELPNLDEPISYAVDNGAQSGPFTMRDIVESVRSGERAPDTYVWWAGETEWVPFNSVDALMTLANPSPQSITLEPEEPVADPPPPTAADVAVDPAEVELDDTGQPGDVFDIVDSPEPEAEVSEPAAEDADPEAEVSEKAAEDAEPAEEAEDPESLGAQMFGSHGASTEIIEAVDAPADAASEAQSFEEPFEAVENPFAEIDNGELDNVDWSREDEQAAQAEAEPQAESEGEALAEPEAQADDEPAVDDATEPEAAPDDDDDADRSPLELVNDRIEALGATGAVALAADAVGDDEGQDPEPSVDDDAAAEAAPAAEVEDSWSELQARSDELASSIVFANHRVGAIADAVVASLSEHGFEVAADTAVGLTHRLHASPADGEGDDVSVTVAGLVTRSGSAGEHVEVSMHRQDASANLIWEMAEYDGNQSAVATAVHSMLAELGRRVGG
jgi:hypothetical protein